MLHRSGGHASAHWKLLAAQYGVHGATQVSQAATTFTNVAWALLLFAGIVASLLSTRQTVNGYFERSSYTLQTIRSVNRLRFPAFFICPKNPDAMNQTLVRRDVEKHFPNITDDSLRNLVAYAVAGAGFGNMGPILRKLSADQLLEVKMQFKEWQGERNLSTFFHTLFTDYGYTFDELLAECRYGNHILNCTDLFTSQYTMLRGRCLRLRAFHQYDSADYGRVFFRVRQVPGWLLEKDGKQKQIVVYVKTPGSEQFTYPRFYFNFQSENHLQLKLQHLKLLDTNPNCNKDCLNCHTSNCYHVSWLRRRIWDPHNCTVFYEWRNAKRYPVCEPDVLVGDYANVENSGMTGEKCLPSCERDVRVIVRHSEIRNTYAPTELTISMYYEHLEYEVLEEISATSIPRFVSELGGQFNLFIGGSMLILVHIGTDTATGIFAVLRRILKRRNSRCFR